MFLFSIIAYSQEVIIVDSEKNPIVNVSAFNLNKTKSALSNSGGIINLSRFLPNDTILLQHPNYRLKTLIKSSIDDFIELELEYQLLDNIIIAESKNFNNIKNDAEKNIYITKTDISELNAATTAELLEKRGGVSVQKSQMGGGSPNIRGFEANRVLLVLDGVRLNNAIYRSGHLQNIITIDEYMLEGIEVMFGPSSVLYGSDAIGGIIHMKTKDLYFRQKPEWHGNMLANYNSAYSGTKHNLSLSFESQNYSTLTNVSFKNFGDLEMGRYRPHEYDDWGLVYHYINKHDSIVCNPNPDIQKGTAYTQYDFLNKMMFRSGKNSRITSNIQYSRSSNIPRFDQLNDGDTACFMDNSGLFYSSLNSCSGGKNLKFHSYYYGPQERFFSSLTFTLFDNYFDKSDFILGYQKINESRHRWQLKDFLLFDPTDDINSDLDQVRQSETVKVYSVNINLRKGNLFFGSETIYNNVLSASSNNENVHSIEDTRYPSGGSNLFSTAFYANVLKRLSHKIQLESGLRYTFSSLSGHYPEYGDVGGVDLYNLLNESSSLKNSIVSGNVKLVYYPSDSWKLSSVSSRGFHSPNVDDMFKVFLKSQDTGDRLTVPYKDLRPEYSLSQEFSITKELNKNITLYGVGFYTQLANAIVLDTLFWDAHPDPDQEYLMSTIPYDGLNPTVFANQNSDKKINIYGLTLGFNAKIWGVIINQDVNLTRCKNTNYGKEPFAHIPPVFGKLEILKEFNNWKFRFLCLFSGPKDSADFDAADVDNLSETPVINEFSNEGQVVNQVYAGLPGWYTLNLSTQYKLNKNIIFQFGVDNILDAHYKTFGSGLSAPGRNFITSINYSF